MIDAEQYLMTCCRYIELNPVRGGLVTNVGDYPWSSYPHHIGLKSDPVITDHPLYWALGNTPFEREAAYKASVELGLSKAELRDVSDATLKGWALGSEAFKLSLEKQTQRRIRQVKRGRPPRPSAGEAG